MIRRKLLAAPILLLMGMLIFHRGGLWRLHPYQRRPNSPGGQPRQQQRQFPHFQHAGS